MAVDRVLLDAQRRQLGKELGGQTGVVKKPQAGRGVRNDHQLVQLVADAFGGHDRQSLGHVAHRLDDVVIGHQVVGGDEARRPHHAQRILPEGHLRPGRGAQPRGGQVGRTVEGVDQLGRRAGDLECHRVDREVAPGQIVDDVGREGHLGLAALRVVHLGPVGGDLHGHPGGHRPDGAEAFALGPQGVGPPAERRLDLLGRGVGREVEVLGQAVAAQEQVAHRAADEVQAMIAGAEALGQGAQAVQ